MARFRATFNSTSSKMNASFSSNAVLNVDFSVSSVIHDKYPDYEGEYEITPKTTEQTLATNHTSMQDDVTIFAIPYSAVSNPQGGETINIAFEG